MKPVDIKKVWNKLSPSERKELESLLVAKTLPTFVDPQFTLQNNFISDPSLLKALLCTRRAGKSYMAGLYLVKTALHRRNTSNIYIGLTRDQAKRIIWNDVFKSILKKYGLEAKFNETELTIQFPNGSIIYILGVDDSDSEKDKLLGKKYALAIIDEAASFHIDLHNLVYKILKPALADHRGTLCLIGTPDDKKSGLFYELTRDIPVQPPTVRSRDGWSVHTWTTFDNPYMSAAWGETIAELERNDPHVRDQSWFQQHYLGAWTIDESNKMYRYSTDRNGWNGVLPQYTHGFYHYTLGIDLGFADATALTLLAYHDHDPHVYMIRSEKRRGLTITDTVAWIREWMGEYTIENFVIDGANRQAVEEMVRHHGLPLVAADKSDKASFIRIMNSDFISGKIKIDTGLCADLISEYDQLIWDKRALERGVYKEHYAFHGDCCDSALYGYRYTYSYAHTPMDRDTRSEAQRELDRWDRQREERQLEREMLYGGSEYLFD